MNPSDMTRATESGSKDYCWECKHWIWDCTCQKEDKVELKVAFMQEYKGFRITAYWPEDHKDAIVKIERDGKPYRDFTYPAYKVFNLAAHFSDIVEGEIEDSNSGYEIAGSDGLGGCVVPNPMPDGLDCPVAPMTEEE